MLHEEQMEEKRKKDQKENQKRIAEVERQKAEEREADRERKPAVLRKQGLKLLGRENMPGALSKAPSCNPGILHFLRHVRFSHNTRLPCCICHCFSMLKYLVYSKGLNIIYRSSTNALGLCFVIVVLFSKLYCKREFMVRNLPYPSIFSTLHI